VNGQKLSPRVKQGDTFSATLFNVSLNVVLEGNVEKGNITYNSKQISAYPADIILITSNTTGLEAVLRALEIEGRNMWFIINEKKSRYKEMSSAQERSYFQHLKIGNFKCEVVNSFTDMGKL